MKKNFLNIIVKSNRIRNRFKNIVGGKRKENHDHSDNDNDDNELDDHNDSSNWSYS